MQRQKARRKTKLTLLQYRNHRGSLPIEPNLDVMGKSQCDIRIQRPQNIENDSIDQLTLNLRIIKAHMKFDSYKIKSVYLAISEKAGRGNSFLGLLSGIDK